MLLYVFFPNAVRSNAADLKMEWIESLKNKERGHRVIAFPIEGREIGSSFQFGPQDPSFNLSLLRLAREIRTVHLARPFLFKSAN